MSFLKDGCCEVWLQQRLTATACNTTAARPQVRCYAADLSSDILTAGLLSATAVPCVRVAAELAAHGTALQHTRQQNDDISNKLQMTNAAGHQGKAELPSTNTSMQNPVCDVGTPLATALCCSSGTMGCAAAGAAAAIYLGENDEPDAWSINS
jgi:hypothetical protein